MKKTKIKVYIASQIFAECWRDYNEKLTQAIEKAYPELDIYLPQRNKSINDKTKCATAEDICIGDFNNNLDSDDIMIAVVDGDTPGIGTTLEIGYFSRLIQEEINKYGYSNKRIISLYTDSRECSNTYLDAKNEKLKEFAECQYSYLNLLLVGCLKRYGKMCRTIDEVVTELGKVLEAYKTQPETVDNPIELTASFENNKYVIKNENNEEEFSVEIDKEVAGSIKIQTKKEVWEGPISCLDLAGVGKAPEFQQEFVDEKTVVDEQTRLDPVTLEIIRYVKYSDGTMEVFKENASRFDDEYRGADHD